MLDVKGIVARDPGLGKSAELLTPSFVSCPSGLVSSQVGLSHRGLCIDQLLGQIEVTLERWECLSKVQDVRMCACVFKVWEINCLHMQILTLGD
jgi:hypothetical protein